MANFDLYFPTLLIHEGGYVNDPADKGKQTNLGVTLAVWIANGYDKDGDGDVDVSDLKIITPDDTKAIAKKLYWDKIGGDKINSQSVAEFVFDFAYNSGVGRAARYLQRAVGVTADGNVGSKTIAAVNGADAYTLFNALRAARLQFVETIVQNDPSQKKFLKGWRNRINSFVFKG